MAKSSNDNWKLGFGLLAGAALGYWLNSDKGRKVRKEIQSTATDYSEQATNYVQEQATALGNTASGYYQQGVEKLQTVKETMNDMVTQKVNEASHEAEEATERASDSIKNGIKIAQEKVNDTAENIF